MLPGGLRLEGLLAELRPPQNGSCAQRVSEFPGYCRAGAPHARALSTLCMVPDSIIVKRMPAANRAAPGTTSASIIAFIRLGGSKTDRLGRSPVMCLPLRVTRAALATTLQPVRYTRDN
jgi:hypothetical protein